VLIPWHNLPRLPPHSIALSPAAMRAPEGAENADGGRDVTPARKLPQFGKTEVWNHPQDRGLSFASSTTTDGSTGARKSAGWAEIEEAIHQEQLPPPENALSERVAQQSHEKRELKRHNSSNSAQRGAPRFSGPRSIQSLKQVGHELYRAASRGFRPRAMSR